MKLLQISFLYILILLLWSCGAKQKSPVTQNAVVATDTAALPMSKELMVEPKALAEADAKKEKKEEKKSAGAKNPVEKPSGNSEIKKVKNTSENGGENTEKPVAKSRPSSKKAKAIAPGKINFLSFDKSKIPASIKYTGKIIHGTKWESKSGEFLLFFTETGAYDSDIDGKDAEVYAYLYRNSSNEGENYAQVWKIHDFVSRCEFELHCNFLKNSISVTDLDNDNSAEVSFAYKNGCKGENTSYTNKIYMIENGRQFKYQAVNGASPVKDEDGNFLGDSWNGVSEEIRTYIQNKWEKNF